MKNSDNIISLKNLPVGKSGKVINLICKKSKRRRLLDLGITPNTIIRNERVSPSGNPIAFNIRGTVIALRKEEAEEILITIL